MSQSAVEVIAAHLTAAGVKVYDSEAGVLLDGSKEVPKGNYAVLYASPGLYVGEGLCGTVGRSDNDFQVTSVGTSPRGARSVAAKVATLTALEGVVHLASNLVRRDTDRPDVTVFFGTDAFTLVTDA